MKVGEWLKQAETVLQAVGISTARLDAMVLLEDVTKIDRSRLLAEPDTDLSPDQVKALNILLSRRAKHTPLAYVRGKTEFYGRSFVVSPAVLEPRPESETMIDLLKKLPDLSASMGIADVGTGSGALGITAKLELPDAFVELIDIDPEALKVAKSNVDLFTLSISVIQGDLLASNDHKYDVLLCNLPYVPDNFAINKAAEFEPRIAIFGGPDGLDLYRKLFDQLQKRANNPLYILTESLPPQHEDLAKIAATSSYTQVDEIEFIQVFKYMR